MHVSDQHTVNIKTHVKLENERKKEKMNIRILTKF